MDSIRQIATSFNGDKIAFGEWEKNVQIIDITKNVVISEFETVLDGSGRRICISEDGNILICGCWYQYGICAYDTKSGKQLWQRKDLKTVQRIQLLRSNNNILFVAFARGTSRLIELNTGNDITKITGGFEEYYESKFQPIAVLNSPVKIQVRDREKNIKKFNIDFDTHSNLAIDIAFSYNSILISDCYADRLLRCYDTTDGSLLWETPESKDCLRLAFNETLEKYVGLSYISEKPFEYKIKYINCNDGTIEQEINIGSPREAEFGFDGNIVITSNKEIIEVITGEKKKLI